MELSEGFRAGVSQFIKDADLDEEFREPFTSIVEQSTKEAVQAVGQLGLEKSAEVETEDLPELGRYLLKAATDTEDAATAARGADAAEAAAAAEGEEEGGIDPDLLRALLLAGGGAGAGALGGYLKPYFMGSQPAENWTRYLPMGAGALGGGLLGFGLGGGGRLLGEKIAPLLQQKMQEEAEAAI